MDVIARWAVGVWEDRLFRGGGRTSCWNVTISKQRRHRSQSIQHVILQRCFVTDFLPVIKRRWKSLAWQLDQAVNVGRRSRWLKQMPRTEKHARAAIPSEKHQQSNSGYPGIHAAAAAAAADSVICLLTGRMRSMFAIALLLLVSLRE